MLILVGELLIRMVKVLSSREERVRNRVFEGGSDGVILDQDVGASC